MKSTDSLRRLGVWGTLAVNAKNDPSEVPNKGGCFLLDHFSELPSGRRAAGGILPISVAI